MNEDHSELGFTVHALDETHQLWEGRLPEPLLCDFTRFDELWNLHPEAYHDIQMGGKWRKTPRWQQAYHRDYAYSGSLNTAQPVPEILIPYWDWARAEIDARLNGLLVNWYEGKLRHYIGKHRDTPNQLVPGSSIVTISFGGERKFRMRPWRGSGFQDFPAKDGTVFVMPFSTNQAWTHEVPASATLTDRRISVTLRAFED